MTVYITSIGIVSAAGTTADANLHALQNGITGLERSPGDEKILGRIRFSNEELVDMLGLAPGDYSRTTLIGLMAAREAWKNHEHNPAIRTGMVSATSVGGLDRMEEYYWRMRQHNDAGLHRKMVHDNGLTTEELARNLGIEGIISTVSTACSSGANALLHAARMMEAGWLDCVLAGGTDPLTRFNIHGFSSLNIYDADLCKPFDERRKGLNLGEGAAFLLLENEHSLSKSGNRPLCILEGWANTADAWHQTASSPKGTGAMLAMQQSLSKAGLKPEDIGYVNAHGTGTENNDLSESNALQEVFGSNLPPFSSTKGFTGHTLAAAGAVEAAFCVMALREQALLPNLHFTTPMKETGAIPVTTYLQQELNHVLSNSFGFGGNCTSLVFGKA